MRKSAIEFIKRVHGKQTDKNGQPYWRHPVRVMMRLGRKASATERHAALLHDVIEDTAATLEDLRKEGFSLAVIQTVDLLSRPSGMTYRDYIRRIALSQDPAAMRVKLADLLDNMAPERIIPDGKTHSRLLKRHRAAERILRKNLPEALQAGLLAGTIKLSEREQPQTP